MVSGFAPAPAGLGREGGGRLAVGAERPRAAMYLIYSRRWLGRSPSKNSPGSLACPVGGSAVGDGLGGAGHSRARRRVRLHVLIRIEYTDTSLTVKFFGDNDGRSVVGEWDDGVGRVEVSFEGGPRTRVVTGEVSERLDLIDPPNPVFVADQGVAVGDRRYIQAAEAGWTTRVTRTITRSGEETTRQWQVDYEPRPATVAVNPCVLADTCPDPGN